jgi:outer membrane protein OmpA-like peptidoglycan-associated protein
VALIGTGLKKDFPADSIRNIHLDTPETKENDPIKTAMTKTTIFEMKNGDYFSGQMTTSRLNINTGQMTVPIDRRNLFRIVFTDPGTRSVEVHLSDGSIQTGVIIEDIISITPYSTSPINIRTSRFQSIQFHTFEYIKKTITPAESNDQEFCIFKCNSGFMSECCHYQTTSLLLQDPDGHVGKIVVQTEGGLQILSEAGQAVIVRNANEPPPLPVFFDEQQIQAIFGKALDAEPPVPEKFILFFKINSTNLLSESKAIIPEIIKSIQERNSFDIHINGYSDRKGTYEYNLALSLKRANYIRQLLVNSGVEDKYIAIISTGEDNPLVFTADGVAEPKNRRVEVIVR